jgi:circadian clock protein KaiC
MSHKHKSIFPKAHSGIAGLDEVTGGGFPKGRSNAGLWQCRMRQDLTGYSISGKRELTEYNEPGCIHEL